MSADFSRSKVGNRALVIAASDLGTFFVAVAFEVERSFRTAATFARVFFAAFFEASCALVALEDLGLLSSSGAGEFDFLGVGSDLLKDGPSSLTPLPLFIVFSLDLPMVTWTEERFKDAHSR